jgi:hypothetical protein
VEPLAPGRRRQEEERFEFRETRFFFVGTRCVRFHVAEPLAAPLCARFGVVEPLAAPLCVRFDVVEPLAALLCVRFAVVEPLAALLCARFGVVEPLAAPPCPRPALVEPLLQSRHPERHDLAKGTHARLDQGSVPEEVDLARDEPRRALAGLHGGLQGKPRLPV